MYVVIDTNILVSALLSAQGPSAKVLALVLAEKLIPCYDYRILDEYQGVLKQPKLNLPASRVSALLDFIIHYGISVVAEPIDDLFIDESDKKFFEVAKHCNAYLVTGNQKHYPTDPLVMKAADFMN